MDLSSGYDDEGGFAVIRQKAVCSRANPTFEVLSKGVKGSVRLPLYGSNSMTSQIPSTGTILANQPSSDVSQVSCPSAPAFSLVISWFPSFGFPIPQTHSPRLKYRERIFSLLKYSPRMQRLIATCP